MFAVKTIDVITLPYQSELVEHSAIFDDVTCIQRYYVDLLRLSLPHLSLPHLSPSKSNANSCSPSVGLRGQEYVALFTA